CLVAARIRLPTVAMTETRVDTERDSSAGGTAAEMFDHVGRSAIHMDVTLHAEVEGLGIEDVGRIDDRRWRTFHGVSGGQGTADFARAHGIDQRVVAAQQI